MPGAIPTSGKFTFLGRSATVVSLNVESPVAEVVDATGAYDSAMSVVNVPTGAYKSSGLVSVEYIGADSFSDLVTKRGLLLFLSEAASVSVNCILESVTMEVRTGELVRGSAKFIPTDFYGS